MKLYYSIVEHILLFVLIIFRDPNDENRKIYISRYEEYCIRQGIEYDPWTEKLYRYYLKIAEKNFKERM